MKSALRKLIPSLVMVLITAAMVGTSTFAWFSMNNKVTVTGMTVTTKVNNNLLISATNSEASYDLALNQTISGLIEPSSTVDAINYFYTSTTNVKATGDAVNDEYTAYNSADTSDFNTNYGTTGAVAYVDYTFYLKGTNADAENEWIYVNRCNLLYNGVTITDKAWRVAFFAQDAVKDTALNTAIVAGDRKSILAPSTATNFSPNNAVSSTTTPFLSAVTYGTAAKIKEVPGNNTAYVKVTVRLWLEGEDTTCNNDTFAALTGKYTLDLEFKLDGNADTNAKTVLGSEASIALDKVSATANVATTTINAGDTLANGEKVAAADMFQWYKADGTILDGATGNSYTNTDTENGVSVYLLVKTEKGNYYRTKVVDLTKKTA